MHAENGSDASKAYDTDIEPTISTVCQSPDAHQITLGSPSILALPGGRLLASVEFSGAGLRKQPGKKGKQNRTGHWIQGHVYVSNDGGSSWAHRLDYPFGGGRLFNDGSVIYLVGYADSLHIIRSADGGENWSKPQSITSSAPEAGVFESGAPSVWIDNKTVYLSAFRLDDVNGRGDISDRLVPVLMHAPSGANLQNRKSWTETPAGPRLADFLNLREAAAVGAPVFRVNADQRGRDLGGGRWIGLPGWSHPRLTAVRDAQHPWHGSRGPVLHCLARACLHRSNIAILMRLQLSDDGACRYTHQKAPSGAHYSLLPLPGGHLPFELTYDDHLGLYWLVGNPAFNSMVLPTRLPQHHAGAPCEERHCLHLSVSRNLVDWAPAGWVMQTDGSSLLSAHEPAASIQGDDLCVEARASGAAARNDRDSNQVIFRRIRNFRAQAPATFSTPPATSAGAPT